MLKILKKSFDKSVSESFAKNIVYGTSASALLRFLGASLTFGFSLVIARLLGAEGAGLYFLALTVVTIASVIARVGLDNVVLRFVAIHAAKLEHNEIKALYELTMRTVFAASCALSCLCFFASNWFGGELFGDEKIIEPIRWMAFSIVPFSIINLQAQWLRGLKKIYLAVTIQSVGIPFVSLILITPLVMAESISGAGIAYLIATITVSVCSYFICLRLNDSACANVPYVCADIWSSAKPLFMTSILDVCLVWLPFIALGILETTENVGIYAIANRIALLLSIFLIALNGITAPDFAALFATGDTKAIEALANRTTTLLSAAVLPLFIITLIFSDHVMNLFGAEFKDGSILLQILITAQILNILSGPGNSILIMTGFDVISRNINMISVATMCILLFLLIPQFGAVGAALSSTFALIMKNFMAMYFVYTCTGIRLIPFASRLNKVIRK